MFELRVFRLFNLGQDIVNSATETQRRPFLVDYAASTAKLNAEVCGSIGWRGSKGRNEKDACNESVVLYFRRQGARDLQSM